MQIKRNSVTGCLYKTASTTEATYQYHGICGDMISGGTTTSGTACIIYHEPNFEPILKTEPYFVSNRLSGWKVYTKTGQTTVPGVTIDNRVKSLAVLIGK